jgi:methylase of polypeptide subunit release factors
VLASDGCLALELSPEQVPAVSGWCHDVGLLEVSKRHDLAGRVRVLTAAPGSRGGM